MSLTRSVTTLQGYPIWHTDNVLPSPVSSGVESLWYPSFPAYNGQMTNCLFLPEPWTTVARAMPTTTTGPVQHKDGSWPFSPAPIDPFVRNHSVAAPAIMGIREWGDAGGRVALLALWNQFLFDVRWRCVLDLSGCSVSLTLKAPRLQSGTKWLFNSEVLSAGIDGRRSDFGKLLMNTLTWLAAPSLQNSSSPLGGYVTTADRLVYPNEQPSAIKSLLDSIPHYDYDKRTLSNDPAAHSKARVFTGLVGAVTEHGGGSTTVQEYAAAATAAGLDFVAFLDPFTALTNESFSKLKQECKQHSTETLKLYPGCKCSRSLCVFVPKPQRRRLRRHHRH